MKRLMLVLAPALLVMVAAASLPTTRAFADDSNIQQMIENAKTAADYQAISDYYSKQAAEAKQQLELARVSVQDLPAKPPPLDVADALPSTDPHLQESV